MMYNQYIELYDIVLCKSTMTERTNSVDENIDGSKLKHYLLYSMFQQKLLKILTFIIWNSSELLNSNLFWISPMTSRVSILVTFG